MKLPWKDILSNIPLALIALPAAYGSAVFEGRVYESPWNVGIGIGVEAAYTGIIFCASKKSKRAFLATALTAMLVGVVYNSLHAADVYGLLKLPGVLGGWILALVHGAPLSILAFSYGMLMHHSNDISEQVEPVASGASPVEVAGLVAQVQTDLEKSMATALTGLPDLVRREVKASLYSPSADGGEVEPASKTAVLSQAQSLLLVGAELPQSAATTTVATAESLGAQVRQMRTAGATWAQIANHFDKPASTVRGWAEKE